MATDIFEKKIFDGYRTESLYESTQEIASERCKIHMNYLVVLKCNILFL